IGRTAMADLHIHLLGGCRLVYRDTPLASFRSPRLQALLAWLLLHANVPQPRAQLATRFWPNSTEGQARTNLPKVVLALRAALPDGERFVRLEGPTLCWVGQAPYHLDVAELDALAHGAGTHTALARAVALYGGDLLPDCYDDWILPERERLRRAFVNLLEDGI